MVKNKDLPDSAAPPIRSLSFCLSLSLSSSLSLSFTLSLSRWCRPSWGITLDPAEDGPWQHWNFIYSKYKKEGKYINAMCVCALSLSRVQLRPHRLALQVPLSKGFSRQEYWRELPFLLQGIFLTRNQTWVSCIAGRLFTDWAMREALINAMGLFNLLFSVLPLSKENSVYIDF